MSRYEKATTQTGLQSLAVAKSEYRVIMNNSIQFSKSLSDFIAPRVMRGRLHVSLS